PHQALHSFPTRRSSDLNDTTVNDRPVGVGRNSARQPSTSSLDVRLSRSFAVRGGNRLDALVEAFNMLNHANVVNVNNTFGTGTTDRKSTRLNSSHRTIS